MVSLSISQWGSGLRHTRGINNRIQRRGGRLEEESDTVRGRTCQRWSTPERRGDGLADTAGQAYFGDFAHPLHALIALSLSLLTQRNKKLYYGTPRTSNHV